jgi:hypothetical protein
MGYRPSYLALRALHHATRRPIALAMIWGYVASAARREARIEEEVRRHVRAGQRISRFVTRSSRGRD